GALSTAFVTTFSRRIATEGDRSAWDLASKVATLTLVFMSAVSLLGVVFAPVLIDILAPGFPAEKAELTVVLTRIMFPFILLVSLAALVMGMLNARHVFGPPAMASAFFNLGSIIGGVTLCYWLDPQPDWRHPHFGERGLVGLSIATLIGGLLQLAVQLPSLRRVGFRFHPDFKWRDPGVRTILGMMGPAMIAASAVQVNVAVNSIFASGLGDGPIAWLNIAFRLMQLPLGIFGVAVATVTLPFLAEPIIQLIYQHGRFTHEATIQTAAALRFYAIGLAGYSADKVLAPAFYALDKRHLPMFVSLTSIAVNFSLNWFFTFHLHLGHRGLALSTSLVAITNFFFLYSMMRHYTKRLETGAMLKTIGKLLVAGTVLVAICWLASDFFFMRYPHAPGWQNLLVMLVTICCGAGAFFSATYLLHVAEVHDLVDLLQRRIGRGGSPEPPKGD
ncbi:MAG: murein biosynthesis integral membrane protein MurJ, partial [Verrucomicrobia bacterium]